MGDINDLMRITGAGRQAVTTAVDKGNLPGYRVGQGNKIWVPDQALDALTKGHWVPANQRNTTHSNRPPFLHHIPPRTEEA